MIEKIGHFAQKKKIYPKNQTKILEVKNTVSKIENSLAKWK